MRTTNTTLIRLVPLLLLVLASGRALSAQPSLVTGYVQTVPLASSATPLASSNGSSFNRLRLTTDPVFGSVSVIVAYEHAVTFRLRSTPAGSGVGVVPGGGEWFDLQWTVVENEHAQWRHRFDRLRMGWNPTGGVELSAGRQAVSWGTTLFLTPADPFSPFSPSDPFREFRAGVDAARIRFNPTPLSEIDVVVRPTKTPVGEELTALGRGLMTVRNWEISGWGGSLYGDPAGAVATAGALGAFALRGEAAIREVVNRIVFRGTIGLDRFFRVAGRDLYLLVEYQHDGLAASSADEYLEVLRSEPFARGELQVLGRDETVLQASYQLHPLWSVSGLWLWNLNDGSALLSPSVAYSASDETAVLGGVLVGIGDDRLTAARPLPSEYGLSGTTAYLSVSWFF